MTQTMQAWRIHGYGAPDEVLVADDVVVPEPGSREVRVRVEAATANFNDIDLVRGRYLTVNPPLPAIPGMEVVGEVDAVGEGVGAEWLGRRVCAVPSGAFGGYAEYACAPLAMTFELPTAFALPDAAALYMPFHLAWQALHARGQLQAGESLLVHAAAGGVGSAAVQLGVLAGARVLATAGSPEKTHVAAQLGADVAIDYRATDFVAAVLEATDGRGVDVAFDTIGGEVTTQTFRCMAYGGRHLMAGFASGIEVEDEGSIVPRPILFGNFSLVGVCHSYVDDPVAVRRAAGVNFPSRDQGEAVHRELLDHVTAGRLRAVVGLDVPWSELPAALAAMERRDTVGRVVIRR
jgi:NADPH2:quinone reductase